MSYASEVLLDGPDVYLPMLESGAGPFVDVANGHNLTPSGTIVTAASLLRTDASTAAKFAAATTLQHSTSTYTVSQQPLTVEFWVNPQSLTGSGANNAYIVSCGLTGGWSAEWEAGSGQWWVTYEGVAFYKFTNGPNAAVGVTQHIAMVLQSGNTIDLYVNGVFRQTISTGALGATTMKYCVARLDTYGLGFPNATIAHVAIYKSALPGYRIAAHYAAGVSGQLLSALGAGV